MERSQAKIVKALCFLILFQPMHSIKAEFKSNSLEIFKLKEQNYNLVIFDYISKIICNESFDYKFYHILTDRSLRTMIADRILQRLGECMPAGWLTTK